MSPAAAPEKPLSRESFGLSEERRRSVTLALFLACLFSLHIVPRGAPPYLFPLPHVDAKATQATLAESRALVVDEKIGRLSHEVRVVGELFRRESSFLASGVTVETLRTDVALALQKGRAEELKILRALQTEYFVSAAKSQDYSKPASSDLLELGGDFHRIAPLSWITEGRFLLSDDELRILFRIRWSKLTGTLEDPTLGISLAELRSYYSAMLRHPPLALGASGGSLALSRDAVIAGAAAVDPEYPLALAAGLNLLSVGQPELARLAFENESRSGRRAARSLRLRHHRSYAERAFESP